MAYGIIEDGGGVQTNQPSRQERASSRFPRPAAVFVPPFLRDPKDGLPWVHSSPSVVGGYLYGKGVSPGTAGNSITKAGISSAAQTKVTFVIVGIRTGSTFFSVIASTSSTNAGFQVLSEDSTTYGLQKGGVAGVGAKNVAVPLDVPYVLVISHDQATGAYYAICRNLVTEVVTTTRATETSTSTAGNGTFSINVNASPNHYIGSLGLVWAAFDFVSEEVGQSLARNPWQLFEADNDPVFYSLAGGSNNTATLSSTLDVVTLTGVGAVTRSGTLAVTLDAATLAGVGAVTRSGTLAVTLDAATLAGVGSVAVGSNREGTLASTLADAALAGIGGIARSATLAVTLDAATLAGVGTAGQPRTGTLAVTLDNATLSGVGAIPAAPSAGGGKTTGKNLSRKQKKKLKAVESQEWLKAEETARQLLSDRFTKQTPQEKAQALETYIESLQPVIEALKALTSEIEEVVEEAPVIELTPHQEVIQRFDRLEKKVKSVEELIIILMADL